MQRRASSTCAPTNAPVGHASRHARQVPQPGAIGSSGAMLEIDQELAEQDVLPAPGAMSIVFFAMKPTPARAAASRSSSGAVSTHARESTGRPAMALHASASACSFALSTRW